MIILDETALWNLMNGLQAEPVQIGWLWPNYRSAIGACTPIVWLSAYNLDHVMLKHKERYYEILKLTPAIIRTGDCYHIEPRKLAFVYIDSTGKPYRSVVKAAGDGANVFLDSTYRIQRSQARNAPKRHPWLHRS